MAAFRLADVGRDRRHLAGAWLSGVGSLSAKRIPTGPMGRDLPGSRHYRRYWPGKRSCTAAAHSVAYSLDEQHAWPDSGGQCTTWQLHRLELHRLSWRGRGEQIDIHSDFG